MKKFLKVLVLGLVTMTSSLLLVACGGISQQTKDSTGGQEVQRPIEKTSCLVTFDSCGGSVVSDQEITRGGKVKKTIPVYSGYDFFGWYTDAQYTKKFDFDSTINQDITLYAKWSNDESELYNFELTNDYSFYGITSYNGESEEITLPRLHNGLRVVSVNSNAFKNNKLLKKVTLPNTIENIYSSAFENCSNLDNLVIPGSVKTIGDNAFQNCSGLTTLTLKNGIKTISAMAFDGCISLGEVVLPNSVTMVGGMAFRHCDSLTAVTISTGMYEIANAMFQYCGSLESITLPTNITKIGNSAFSYCYSLENLQILGNITLFGNSAFYDCQNLKSIYWAANVTGNYQSGGDNYIFYNAGKSNNGITLTMAPNANLPVGVFMPYQNSNIPKITTLIFEDSTTTIDSTEYNRMPYLTSITAPDSVREITTGIFDNTPWYQAQPNGVVCINNIVYGYKGNYASNIIVPDNVVAFGNNVFAGATGITSLSLPFIGRSKDANETGRLFGALFSTETYNGGTQIQQKYANSKTINFYIPQTLKNVSITKETVIPYGAFSGCINLNTIDLSHCVNLSEVESYAFGGFDNLDNVVFPEQEITLASNAYENMPSTLISIENLNSANGSVQNVQTTTINKTFTLTASANSGFYIVWYDENDDLLKTANAITVTTKPSLTLIKVDFKESDYTISFDSNGGISINDLPVAYNDNFELPIPVRAGYDFAGWYYNDNQIENGIYTYASNINLVAHWNAIFTTQVNGTNCTITGLTNYGKNNYNEINIPNQIDGHAVVTIGTSAFSNCTSLTQIDLTNCLSLQRINDYAFYGIEKEKILLPSQEIVIGNYVYNTYPNELVTAISNLTDAGTVTVSQNNIVNASSNLTVNINSGYTFEGWYNASDSLITTSNVLIVTTTFECQTYYAKFHKNEIIITFDSNKGIPCVELTVPYEGTMTLPTTTRNGYDFDGWYYGNNKIEDAICDFITDVTLTAKWNALFNLSLSNNEYTITGLTSYSKANYNTIIIPENIDGINVTNIGSSAFYNYTSLKSVILPDTITNIGASAFYGIDREIISFPNKEITIGKNAYKNCPNAFIVVNYNISNAGNVNIPKANVVNATMNLTMLVNSGYTFDGWYDKSDLLISTDDTITVTSSFECQTYYAKFHKNNIAITFNSNGGSTCAKLTVPYQSEMILPTPTHENCSFVGWYYNETKVENGVCDFINNVTLTAKWETIFTLQLSNYQYTSQYTITGLTDDGKNNFQKITIPASISGYKITNISANAFENCTNLNSITIPSSVKTVGREAFYGCTNLSSVVLSDGITEIGSRAFANTNLTDITIPASVITVRSYAFGGKLSSMNYLGTLNQWLSITFESFDANPTYYTKKLVIKGEEITKLDWSSGQRIQNYSFINCENLVSVRGVESVGISAFSGCTELNSFYFAVGDGNIGVGAFSGCTSLNSINIESAYIENIGSYAFYGCTGLSVIVIRDSVTQIGENAFSNWTKKQFICVKAEKIPDGWDANWCDNIPLIITNGWIEGDYIYSIQNGYYVIAGYLGHDKRITTPYSYDGSGTGVGKTIKVIGEGAFRYNNTLESITISSGVEQIWSEAFLECTSLTDIVLSGKTTSIRDSAFSKCVSLTNIKIPDSVEYIGNGAFSECTSLTSVILPWNSEFDTISTSLFKGCTNLTSVGVTEGKGNHIQSIFDEAFYGCSALEEIDLTSVRYIGNRAFYECTSLTKVEIYDGSVIQEFAFSGCTNLTNIIFVKYSGENDGIEIRGDAFSNCTSLTYVRIKSNVKNIGSYVFSGCKNLKNIYCEVAEKPETWNSNWNSSSAEVVWGYQGSLL